MAVSGVFSDGFKITGVPTAMAGAILCNTWFSGWLNGVIQTARDKGSRSVKIFRAFPDGDGSRPSGERERFGGFALRQQTGIGVIVWQADQIYR